jgi:hypothetical protein
MGPTRYLSALAALMVVGALAPAWAADKVLVPGDAPLTQQTVDLYQEMWESYTEVRLTPEQRRKHTQLFVAFWKKRDRFMNQQSLTGYKTMEKEWRDLLKLKEADQRNKRLAHKDNWMAALRKSTADVDRFLVSAYDAAYKPGGPNNPILVAGDPPLTQVLVNTYAQFFQYLFALTMDAEDLKAFQGLVVADWKEWDAAARADFLKRLAAWEDASRKGNRFAYRAKLLPGYLDRQGDPKQTSAAERWMLESYRSLYKKLADEVATARMDKQPAAHAAAPGDHGFPDDPKHSNIFLNSVVFTQSHVFFRHWGVDFYVDRVTGKSHTSYQYWWFFPTGRFYTRNIRCLGSQRVKGTEDQIIVSSYYLEERQVTDNWGRYTIDDKDRIQMQTDKGEKITMHLTYGRKQLNWGGTVYDAPPKKK